MGAAYDAMCENEGLQSRMASKNRQIREQKKLIIELAEGIDKWCDGAEGWTMEELKDRETLHKKAITILAKLNKKKKK